MIGILPGSIHIRKMNFVNTDYLNGTEKIGYRICREQGVYFSSGWIWCLYNHSEEERECASTT